jgi:hypothetical protein
MSEKVQSIIESIKGLSLLEGFRARKRYRGSISASARPRPRLRLPSGACGGGAAQRLPRKRPISAWCSLLLAATRSASSKSFARSRASV